MGCSQCDVQGVSRRFHRNRALVYEGLSQANGIIAYLQHPETCDSFKPTTGQPWIACRRLLNYQLGYEEPKPRSLAPPLTCDTLMSSHDQIAAGLGG
jgi:hypothetical protein